MTLVAFWLNKSDELMKDSNANKLYLIALGLVSGFVGYRILPGIAIGLEKRMDILERESHLALRRAIEAALDARDLKKEAFNTKIARGLTDATTVIEHKGYLQGESMLYELRKADPLNAAINFTLSNLYKRNNKFDNAIGLMNQYIKQLRDAKKKALYNRACYVTLKAKGPPRDGALTAQALDDLKTAVDLNPSAKDWAWNDDDFVDLRTGRNTRFSEIVGREYPDLTGSDTGLA